MPRGLRLAGIFGVVFCAVAFRGVRGNIWGSGFRLGGLMIRSGVGVMGGVVNALPASRLAIMNRSRTCPSIRSKNLQSTNVAGAIRAGSYVNW